MCKVKHSKSTLTLARPLRAQLAQLTPHAAVTGRLVSLLAADARRQCSAPLSAVGGASGRVTSLYGEMSLMTDSWWQASERRAHLATEDAISTWQPWQRRLTTAVVCDSVWSWQRDVITASEVHDMTSVNACMESTNAVSGRYDVTCSLYVWHDSHGGSLSFIACEDEQYIWCYYIIHIIIIIYIYYFAPPRKEFQFLCL